MTVFHGSENIIYTPTYGLGNAANDFGRGFYCTESSDIAKEWACKKGRDGFLNQYSLDTGNLSICNLNDGSFSILHWLALLTHYRGYWQKKSIAEEAKNFLQEKYYFDIEPYDLIIAYRADDSYFSFAQDFIMGTISMQKLSEAMRLGKLGEQIVLKSRKAFEHIKYESNEAVPADIYYRKKAQRDLTARREYIDSRKSQSILKEIYILDIMRGAVSEDELRI